MTRTDVCCNEVKVSPQKEGITRYFLNVVSSETMSMVVKGWF